MKMIYSGKAKEIYDIGEEGHILMRFKDDITAGNGKKHSILEGKGKLTYRTNKYFFNIVSDVPNHYVRDFDEVAFVAKKLKMIPLEVVMRNFTAGSFCKRYGVKKGMRLKKPLFELFLKDDSLGDPLICEETTIALGLTNADTVSKMYIYTSKINHILSEFLSKHSILLVDFKLEFGFDEDGELLVGDEITQDTCRFWDADTKESLDKDVYRESIGDPREAYRILLERIGG